MQSWFRLGFTSILCVDFGSASPVRNEPAVLDAGVEVLTVPGTSRWILADAYNFGLENVSGEYCLKLDADHSLSPHILKDLDLDDHSFRRGDFSLNSWAQRHVNGALFAQTEHLRRVGGWNKEIRTYGWDDSDLYQRLIDFGLRSNSFSPRSIWHLKHPDSERVSSGAGKSHSFSPQTLIQVNRVLTERKTGWNPYLNRQSQDSFLPRHARPSSHEFISNSADAVLSAIREISRHHEEREPETRRFAERLRLWLQELLSGGRRLSRRFVQRIATVGNKAVPLRPIVLVPEHGLGNRLRALASWRSLAVTLGVDFTVVWRSDVHLQARLDDLIDYGGQVLNDPPSLLDCFPGGFKEVHSRDGRVPLWMFVGKKPLVIQTQSRVRNRLASEFFERRFLRNLIPSEPVQRIYEKLGPPGFFGVHIRQVGGPEFSRLPWEAEDNWGTDQNILIGSWRRKASVERFTDVISTLERAFALKKTPLFLCTDNEDSQKEFLISVPHASHNTADSALDRSTASVQQALAELLLLSESQVILGSGYSSFSEVAYLRSSPGTPILLSGIHF